jgi:membrane-associated protease RseP (regulator of RpoE activity)
MRIDSRKDDGRRVVEVIAKTDAATMGLRKNDVIVEMDGRPIRAADDIGRAFDAHRAGGPLTFLVRRGTRQVTLQVPFPPSLSPVTSLIFERRAPWGRVDLERHGNTIDAKASGVGTFTVLLSPARFDFARPIVVNVNGTRVHDGPVERDVATLLRWAARDQDRTMLFGAALQIHVPR